MTKFKLGKSAKKVDSRTLQFAKYVKGININVPATIDYTVGIIDWKMMLNNSIGDCTCAAIGHLIEAWTKAGKIVPDNLILAFYSAISGYDPVTGNNDNGAAILDVLNKWQKDGLDDDKIGAYAEININDLNEVKTALYLFNGIDIGIQCPDSAQTQFENGQVWTVVPGAQVEGGHSIILVGFDGQNWLAVTWGALVKIDPAFLTTYMDEAYVTIDNDYLTGGKTLEGFDINSLIADLKAISDGTYNIDPNIVNPPNPVPTPTPSPILARESWLQRFWEWIKKELGTDSPSDEQIHKFLDSKGI